MLPRQRLAAEHIDDRLELRLVGIPLEHLAGLEKADTVDAPILTGTAVADMPAKQWQEVGPLHLRLLHQAAVGFDARLASVGAQVERLAKRAAVDALVIEAPVIRVRTDQAQRQSGGGAEGVLIHPEPVRLLGEAVKQEVLRSAGWGRMAKGHGWAVPGQFRGENYRACPPRFQHLLIANLRPTGEIVPPRRWTGSSSAALKWRPTTDASARPAPTRRWSRL